MCLLLFSIVVYRTIVTVYTDNIFLYNYLRQMQQIINLSPLWCFTPARGKTVQKNREVSGVNILNTYRGLTLHEDSISIAVSIHPFQPSYFRGGQLGHRPEPVSFLISSQLSG